MIRPLTRVVFVALVTVMALAAPARAHVEVEESSVDPSGAASVTFSFHHGCAGQPTTSLHVQIPVGVSSVVPQPVDGWQATTTGTDFTWTGGSIPDGQVGTFTATMQVSGAAGSTIWFPAVQGCPDGEEAWIETAEPGAPEPENVAPSIVLVTSIQAPTDLPATTGSPTTVAPSTTRTTLVPGEAAVTKEGSPTNNTGLVVGLVAVGAIVVGALVLFLRYRGKGNTSR